jgi:hypothetical protein
MSPEQFVEGLKKGKPVPLSAEEWDELGAQFPVEECHSTQLAGDLLIVRTGEGLAAVESPSRGARVARLLGSPREAAAFVARRMEEYERMWDGCGVKVDYYEGRSS